MKNIVIIHGIGGIEKEPYFPHLKQTCEELNLKVFMPSLGGYRENITYDSWQNYFDNNILPFINNDTIVVAQSLGTQFSVKYIAEKNLNIKAYISCAGPYDVLNMKKETQEKAKVFEPISKQFMPSKEEYKKIKNKTFSKYSLFCDNDKFFELQNLEEYSKAIGSTPILIKGKGHFDFSANVFEFNELEDLIKKLY